MEKENYKANARLIAAAPELLEKLDNLVRAVNVKEIDPLVVFIAIEQAQTAINKATKGEA